MQIQQLSSSSLARLRAPKFKLFAILLPAVATLDTGDLQAAELLQQNH
jgi:hypothetical protein